MNKDPNATFQNLEPYTQYNFTVCSINSIGKTCTDGGFNVTTLEDGLLYFYFFHIVVSCRDLFLHPPHSSCVNVFNLFYLMLRNSNQFNDLRDNILITWRIKLLLGTMLNRDYSITKPRKVMGN